jgi:ABC-2 type transport system ATP-binding protein
MKELLLRRPKRSILALDGISIELLPGKVTALLGPNGAGKTTLINIICDLTRADTGYVSVAGNAIPEKSLEARNNIGYVTTNDRSFFWRLTGRKNLEFFAALHGFTLSAARKRCDEMLQRFDLVEQADRPFHSYSAGMKKRLGLARAFLHDPPVLLMDEATNGLDAKSTEQLLGMIKEQIKGSSKTVFWATHRTEEVERLCDRVIVLIGGRIYYDNSIEEFREISRRHQTFVLEIKVTGDIRPAFERLLNGEGIEDWAEKVNDYVEINGVGDEKYLSQIIRKLLELGVLVKQVERRPEPLHKIFSHLKDDNNNPDLEPHARETTTIESDKKAVEQH